MRLESLKEKLYCLLPVGERVKWGLSQQNWMLLGRDLQIVEDVSPQELHVLDVNNYTVFDRVRNLKHSLVLLD